MLDNKEVYQYSDASIYTYPKGEYIGSNEYALITPLNGDMNQKAVKIILTIAHLDHDEENWDVKDDRLAALCQKCHLEYDRPEKQRRRKEKKKKHQKMKYEKTLFPFCILLFSILTFGCQKEPICPELKTPYCSTMYDWAACPDGTIVVTKETTTEIQNIRTQCDLEEYRQRLEDKKEAQLEAAREHGFSQAYIKAVGMYATKVFVYNQNQNQ